MKPNNNYLLPYRNYTAFTIGAVSFVFYLYTQYTLISNFPMIKVTESLELVIICQILILSCAIWASQIAKSNNHGALLWFFISLFIGPLGLIILSIRDRKINDPRINSLVLKFRNEFKSQLKLAPENKELIVNELQSKLNIEISKVPFAFTNIEETTIMDYNPEWSVDNDKCPACGNDINKQVKYCSACGLHLR